MIRRFRIQHRHAKTTQLCNPSALPRAETTDVTGLNNQLKLTRYNAN